MNKKRNMVLTLCLAALLTCGIAATNVAADDIIVVDDETASVVAVDTEDAVAEDDTSFTPVGTEENIAVAEDSVTVWHSGTCGENMTWTLYNTGTMVIEGEGAITDISTWSEYKVLIKSVVFDARITTIPQKAFQNCTALTEITIPDACAVKYLAFGDTNVQIVNVRDSVTSVPSDIYELKTIQKFVVDDTDGDKYYDIDGVLYYYDDYKEEKTIVKYPLAKELKGTYTIDEGTNFIGQKAFCDMTEATEIIMPDTVTSIGTYAFSGCTKLAVAHMSPNVEIIGERAYEGCTALTEITIPDACAVKYLAFGDTNVQIVNVRDSVTSVPSDIYELKTIQKFVVDDTDNDRYYDIDGVLYYYDDTKEEKTVVKYPLSKKLKGTYTIDEGTNFIGQKAFCDMTEATEIIMPDTVTSIGKYAFSGCTKLAVAHMSPNVEIINERAYEGCTALTEITIPDACAVKYLAFGDTNVQIVNVRDSVTSVPSDIYELKTIQKFVVDDTDGDKYYDIDGVLYYYDDYKEEKTIVKYPLAKKLKGTYTIDEGTNFIGQKAFSDMTEATEIIMPDTVTSIGKYAFSGCTKLTVAHMSPNVEIINERAYEGCTALTEITIPDACTVKYLAFGDTNVQIVNVRDSVTSVPSDIYELKTIQKFVVDDTDNDRYYDIDGVLYYYDDTKEEKTVVKYPLSKKLKGTYTIDEGTNFIGQKAFCDMTEITEIIMPDTVTSIGKYAFSGCTKLVSVYFYGGTPTIGDRAFNSVASGFTMYYIEGQSGWSTPTWNGYTTATWIPEGTTVTPDPEIYNATLLGNMQKYFSGYSVTLDSVADIDGDGTISRKDAMILARYLADWEGYADYFKLS